MYNTIIVSPVELYWLYLPISFFLLKDLATGLDTFYILVSFSRSRVFHWSQLIAAYCLSFQIETELLSDKDTTAQLPMPLLYRSNG